MVTRVIRNRYRPIRVPRISTRRYLALGALRGVYALDDDWRVWLPCGCATCDHDFHSALSFLFFLLSLLYWIALSSCSRSLPGFSFLSHLQQAPSLWSHDRKCMCYRLHLTFSQFWRISSQLYTALWQAYLQILMIFFIYDVILFFHYSFWLSHYYLPTCMRMMYTSMYAYAFFCTACIST